MDPILVAKDTNPLELSTKNSRKSINPKTRREGSLCSVDSKISKKSRVSDLSCRSSNMAERRTHKPSGKDAIMKRLKDYTCSVLDSCKDQEIIKIDAALGILNPK